MRQINVIYEDTDIIVIAKPSGVMVHTDGRSKEYTVVDWVQQHYPSIEGVGESMRLQNGVTIRRPGVVHRLDRETSGILVLAKTQEAFLHLKNQFQTRSVHKTYHSVVWGVPQRPTGTIDKPIGRSRKDFRLWSATAHAKGTLRDAVTRWTLLGACDGYAYLAVEPKTGRTHQIRVHMKAIGHPIVCDTRYAPQKGCALGFSRLALHARAISFLHPRGTRMEMEAPFPEDFVYARTCIGVEE